MNKSELKAAGMHEIGCRVDDLLEGTKARQEQIKGEKTAFLFAAKQIGSDLIPKMEADKLTPKQREVCKRWLVRAIGSLENLALRCDTAAIATGGKVQALEIVVDEVSKMYDQEKRRAEIKPEDKRARVEGKSLKEQRAPATKKAKSSKKKAKKKSAKNAG